MSDRYVRRYGPGRYAGEWTESLDGTDWWAADPPRRWHRCRPQTRAWMSGELIERCTCGGLRFDGRGPWIDRNTSKPMTPAEKARHEHSRMVDALIDEYPTASTERQREIRELVARDLENQP